MVEEESKIEIGCARMEMREDGILHVHIKVDEVFEIADSHALVQARTRLVDGRRTPIIYTCSEFVIPSKEVREFVASENRSKMVTADAFVVNSLPQRLVANFFIKINKPVRPVKVFDNFDAAREWILKYVTEL